MNGHRGIVPSPVFIAARSYAKVNLCLAVAGPEPEGAARVGWHRIASWFHAVDLFDDVYVERAVDGKSMFERSFAADAPKACVIDWPLEKDLCFRAVGVLEEYCRERLAVKVRVKKRIPSGGGLGGGSSNAATVLRTLNSLFGLEIEDEVLKMLSQKLGSDVPFFMDGALDGPPRPAIVRGFGERVERVKAVRGEVTLVFAEFGCATPAVYQMFDAMERPERGLHEPEVAAAAARAIARGRIEESELFNDLRAAAMAVEPRLGAMIARIENGGAKAMLSGSGSTLFVVGEHGRLSAEIGEGAVVYRTRLV